MQNPSWKERKMPSDFLSPFLELDDALCKTFLSLNVDEDLRAEARTPPGFQRTFSACPVTLSASSQSASDCLDGTIALHAVSDQGDPVWPLQGSWDRDSELPRTSLQDIPFRADRSVSLIEGCRGEAKGVSSRYKTELCRTFEESGSCKYGTKCQFAHGAGELRGLSRHPKYKTEPCRTFHTSGICPYGARCHFIHNAEERRAPSQSHQVRPRSAQLLCHRISSGGYSMETLPSPSPPAPPSLHLSKSFFPCNAITQPPAACSLCTGETALVTSVPFAFPNLLVLQKSLSADSLSDQEDSGSSGGSSGSESPGLGPLGRRLPIFSQLSVSND
ncbi:mRNA decay activator protein ZFP36L2-like [Sceloporus undulatus]|uniref:mRNA decay activator protein ZFP36L2-like n=1 Tax=Sceloporus undulatus TaxID=8520 RepID=UPI001C4C53D2|nr:mRNA decay activator protein ZFP36L2-like [Sceloporus undulatus]